MASGDSTPPVAAAGSTAITVNARTVENLQVADRITNIRSTTQGGSTMPVKRLAVQGSDSGPDTKLPDGRPCRSNQTDLSPIIWIGHQDEMIVANHYTNINYHLNTQAVQTLLDAKCNLESIQGALGQCLAGLDWSSEAILQQKLTAFKLTLVDEKLPMLLQTVINHISNTTNMRKLTCLVVQAFREFGALLKAMKVSSLTFIFQHTEDAKAEELLRSEEAQGRLITVLYQFLPNWVCVHARWEVRGCAWEDCGLPSTCDAEPLVTWRLPLLSSSLYAESQTKEAVDVVKLMHTVEPVIRQSIEQAVDRAVAPIHNAIDQIHRAVLRPEIAQDESPQQDLQQQLSHPPSEDESGDPDSHSHVRLQQLKPRSLVGESGVTGPMSTPHSQEIQLYKSTPHVTRLSHSRTSYTTTFAEVEATRPTSMPHLFYPGGSPSFEPKNHAEHPDQTGSPAHRDLMLSSKSSDFPQASVVLSEGYMSQADLAELRKDSEKIVNSRSHSHRGTGQEAAQEREEPTAGKETSHKAGRETDTVAASASEKASKIKEAEQLLSWVNVKTKASQSKSPEIQRLMEQTALALQEEENVSPMAKAMDTVIVLDTSDSIAENHLDELKAAAHAFVDGIEENVEMMNLEENLAVIQMGGRAWVRQHLTNDYNRIREAIDAMEPDSPLMPTGGRTPLFQALVVCLGAIEDRGGVINVAGCHFVRPRLIVFTDGRPTDETTERGPDMQSNLQQVKYALAQLITEFSAKKHRTTPLPIFWVPIGADVDMVFLDSLARLGGGKVISKDNIAELYRYFKVQQTIGCVSKLVLKNKDVFADEAKILNAIGALAGNLSEAETAYILDEVQKKRTMEPEDYMKCDDYHNVFEDTESVNDGTLPPLGTRVVRGPDWKWENQDEGGPGTVLQHDKTRGHVYVMWDTGQYNLYRYGHNGFYDIQPTQDFPRIMETSTSLAIGVEVRRGADWKGGDEDDQGVGVVIRTHKRGKVKVRWENGHIGSYVYGEDKREVKSLITVRPRVRAGEQSEEELGAMGGYDPDPDASRRVWQWFDGRCWQTYDEMTQEKLQEAYAKRKNGTCVIERDGVHRRVIFQRNEERTMNTGVIVKVQSKVVPVNQYQRMLQKEYTLPPSICLVPPEQESSKIPITDFSVPGVNKRPSSSQVANIQPTRSQDVIDLETECLAFPTESAEVSGKLTVTPRKTEGDPSYMDQGQEPCG